MKLKYLNIGLLIAAVSGLTACNGFLDREPES